MKVEYLPQFFPAYWIAEVGVYGMPFTEEIAIGFVKREDGFYTYLLKEGFPALCIEPDELLALSIKNLDSQLESCDIKEYKLQNGAIAFWSAEKDNFTAARLLSPNYLAVLKRIFDKDFNFSIPDRDTITCWQTTDSNEMEKLANETREDFDNSDYGLSKKVYRFSNVRIT